MKSRSLVALAAIPLLAMGVLSASPAMAEESREPLPPALPLSPPIAEVQPLTPLLLTFMQDCDPAVNVWRVRNPNPGPVMTDPFGEVPPGDSFYSRPGGAETIVLKWDGGQNTKAGGNDGNQPTAQFAYSWDGAGGFTVTVTGHGCSTGAILNVSSYTLDQSAANESTEFGAGNPTSYPQSLYEHGTPISLPASTVKVAVGDTFTGSVSVPACGDYQADLYTGAPLDVVGEAGHGSTFLAGGIVLQAECEEPPVEEPPTEEPPTSTPPTDELAQTGTSEVAGILIGVAALLTALGGALVGRRSILAKIGL